MSSVGERMNGCSQRDGGNWARNLFARTPFQPDVRRVIARELPRATGTDRPPGQGHANHNLTPPPSCRALDVKKKMAAGEKEVCNSPVTKPFSRLPFDVSVRCDLQ